MATTGLLTATKTAVLNQPGDFLLKVFYYDDLGRSVKTYAQHYYQSTVDTGNYDAVSNTYNFTNAVTGTTRQHYNYTGDPLTPKLTINNTFQYDHLGRKTGTWETITGDSVTVPKTLISKLDYNELGQVLTKHLGSRDSLNFLQDVGYRYNERGWLTQSHSGLFTEQLQYNQAGLINGMATIPQYNGNIVSQSWNADTVSNTFGYFYDRLNRLTSGVTADSAYAERNITYDQAGNIQTLSRVYAGNLTDSLVYNYIKNAALTNQVQTIQDLSTDLGTTGFAAGTGTYHYDPNGNMNTFSSTNPAAKTYSTTYNLLNLPNLVHSNVNSVYEYDASGEKLSRIIDTNETDYIDGIQYDNNHISFIQTEEGRVFPYSADTSNYYEYYLADHLGNSRIAFDTPHDTLKVEQQDDYMPFGMEISQGTVENPKNEYLYNKKELQENTQLYDYGARFYDPVVARWTTVDPLADMSPTTSPYVFCVNNPVLVTDKLGLDTGKVHQLPEVKITGIRRWTNDIMNSLLWNSGPFMAGHFKHKMMQTSTLNAVADANNLNELVNNSLAYIHHSVLKGELLEKLKKDAAFKKWRDQIISILKANPQFKNITFEQSQLIEFGGDAWSSLSNFESAAGNELTWAVRHAPVDVSAVVKQDGTIVMNFSMSDTLDLSAQPGRGFGYNSLSSTFGMIYHDFMGGNPQMKVTASWTETSK